MKLKTLVATLGLTVGLAVSAAPFVPNSPAPSPIGPTPGSEQSLQAIADSVFGPGHIDVNTDQSSAALFGSATPGFATSIPTKMTEFTANDATRASASGSAPTR